MRQPGTPNRIKAVKTSMRSTVIFILLFAPQPFSNILHAMASTTIILIVTTVFFAPALSHSGRKGGSIRCGLPPFADSEKLSADVRDQLISIWTGYVEGTDCNDRKEQTKTLIKSLPDDIRESLRPMKPQPPCGLPSFFDKLPIEIQPQVQAIWGDYVAGEDCKQKQKETRELLKTLTAEQKKALRPLGGRGGNPAASRGAKDPKPDLWKDGSVQQDM